MGKVIATCGGGNTESGAGVDESKVWEGVIWFCWLLFLLWGMEELL